MLGDVQINAFVSKMLCAGLFDSSDVQKINTREHGSDSCLHEHGNVNERSERNVLHNFKHQFLAFYSYLRPRRIHARSFHPQERKKKKIFRQLKK